MASSGERCKAKPHKDGLCYFHSDPARAAELGRKGGLRNRHVYTCAAQDVVVPETASDVKRLLAESMADIRTGKLNPRLGNTIAYVATSLLRAIEVADIQVRLAKLEQKGELENET